MRIRECDNLVFVLNTTGAYIEPYEVKVQCFPQSFGSGGKTISVYIVSVQSAQCCSVFLQTASGTPTSTVMLFLQNDLHSSSLLCICFTL